MRPESVLDLILNLDKDFHLNHMHISIKKSGKKFWIQMQNIIFLMRQESET
jgi:hypothetical protein